MGVLNLTPDSFSDGGRWSGQRAVRHALAMLAAGADVIDVGGESTRPGADPVSDVEEIARVTPVIAALRAQTSAPISIDTMKPAVARAAIEAGATLWNDVAALTAPGALEAAGEFNAPVILMHMQGEPRTMQRAPHYDDVVADVAAFLAGRAQAARAAGVREVWIDPGFGFGKTPAHNLAVLNACAHFKEIANARLVFGASRKSSIEKLEGVTSAPDERVGGSIALALAAMEAGADMLRVHDVRETAQAIALWRAARSGAFVAAIRQEDL